MGFSEASRFSKIALILSAIAVLFDIIGFPTPYWASVSYTLFTVTFSSNQGLFQLCSEGVCVSIPGSVDWLDAAKALNIIGFLLGVGSLVVLIIYVLVKNDMKLLQLVGLALAFAAGFFVIVGSAVFAGKITEGPSTPASPDLSWSFALTIIAGVLYVVEGVVIVLDKVMVG